MTKAQAVQTLIDEWSSIDGLLADLPEHQWAKPTCLPGWSVQDVVAHLIGGELGIADKQPPPAADISGFPHVRNEIGAINERWVESMRAEPPEQVHRRYREVTASRAETLTAMSEEDFNAPSWTPAGQDTYARFVRIRLFDCWMHEQDIRHAVETPGNDTGACAETSLDEITAALGYIVGKRAAAPQGSSVVFELDGPIKRTINVLVDGRAKLVDGLPGLPTATLTMSSTTFTRLAGGRIPLDPGLAQLHGDKELANRVLFALPYTI